MSTWGGQFDGHKDDVSEFMRMWLNDPDNLTRMEIIGHLADCLREATEYAAFLDADESPAVT